MAQAQKQVKINCSGCGTETVAPREQAENGEELFCSDCLVETDCRQCGQSLSLTKDKFAEVDGNPVCIPCDSGTTQSNGSSWSWLVVGGVLGIVVLALNWYYRPTISLNLGPYMGVIEAIAGPGLLVVLLAIWRSIK